MATGRSGRVLSCSGAGASSASASALSRGNNAAFMVERDVFATADDLNIFTVASLRRMLPPAQAAPAKKGDLVDLLVTLQLFRKKDLPTLHASYAVNRLGRKGGIENEDHTASTVLQKDDANACAASTLVEKGAKRRKLGSAVSNVAQDEKTGASASAKTKGHRSSAATAKCSKVAAVPRKSSAASSPSTPAKRKSASTFGSSGRKAKASVSEKKPSSAGKKFMNKAQEKVASVMKKVAPRSMKKSAPAVAMKQGPATSTLVRDKEVPPASGALSSTFSLDGKGTSTVMKRVQTTAKGPATPPPQRRRVCVSQNDDADVGKHDNKPQLDHHCDVPTPRTPAGNKGPSKKNALLVGGSASRVGSCRPKTPGSVAKKKRLFAWLQGNAWSLYQCENPDCASTPTSGRMQQYLSSQCYGNRVYRYVCARRLGLNAGQTRALGCSNHGQEEVLWYFQALLKPQIRLELETVDSFRVYLDPHYCRLIAHLGEKKNSDHCDVPLYSYESNSSKVACGDAPETGNERQAESTGSLKAARPRPGESSDAPEAARKEGLGGERCPQVETTSSTSNELRQEGSDSRSDQNAIPSSLGLLTPRQAMAELLRCRIVPDLLLHPEDALAGRSAARQRCRAGEEVEWSLVFPLTEYEHVLEIIEDELRDRVSHLLLAFEDGHSQLRVDPIHPRMLGFFRSCTEVEKVAARNCSSIDLGQKRSVEQGTLVGFESEGVARLRALGMWENLRPYQREGARFCLRRMGESNSRRMRVLLADEMGLGKTRQAVAAVVAAGLFPCLIVVKAVTRLGWKMEIELFAARFFNSSRDVHVIASADDALADHEETPRMVLCSYHMCVNLLPQLLRRRWQSAIVDEAHCLRSSSSSTTASASDGRGSNSTTNVSSKLQKEPPCSSDGRQNRPKFGWGQGVMVRELTRLLRTVPNLLLVTGTPCVRRIADLRTQLALLLEEEGEIQGKEDGGTENVGEQQDKVLDAVDVVTSTTKALPQTLKKRVLGCRNGAGKRDKAQDRKKGQKTELLRSNPEQSFLDVFDEYTKGAANTRECDISTKRAHEFHLFLQTTVMLRRLKGEVMSQLPRVQELPFFVPLTAASFRGMERLFQESCNIVPIKDDTLIEDADASSSKTLIHDGPPFAAPNKKLAMGTVQRLALAKLYEMRFWLRELILREEKVVIFAHHKRVFDMVVHWVLGHDVGAARSRTARSKTRIHASQGDTVMSSLASQLGVDHGGATAMSEGLDLLEGECTPADVSSTSTMAVGSSSTRLTPIPFVRIDGDLDARGKQEQLDKFKRKCSSSVGTRQEMSSSRRDLPELKAAAGRSGEHLLSNSMTMTNTTSATLMNCYNTCGPEKTEFYPVALVSMTAAGIGVNGLEVASTAVFLELPESANWWVQCRARIDRFGQRASTIFLHYVIGAAASSSAQKIADGCPEASSSAAPNSPDGSDDEKQSLLVVEEEADKDKRGVSLSSGTGSNKGAVSDTSATSDVRRWAELKASLQRLENVFDRGLLEDKKCRNNESPGGDQLTVAVSNEQASKSDVEQETTHMKRGDEESAQHDPTSTTLSDSTRRVFDEVCVSGGTPLAALYAFEVSDTGLMHVYFSLRHPSLDCGIPVHSGLVIPVAELEVAQAASFAAGRSSDIEDTNSEKMLQVKQEGGSWESSKDSCVTMAHIRGLAQQFWVRLSSQPTHVRARLTGVPVALSELPCVATALRKAPASGSTERFAESGRPSTSELKFFAVLQRKLAQQGAGCSGASAPVEGIRNGISTDAGSPSAEAASAMVPRKGSLNPSPTTFRQSDLRWVAAEFPDPKFKVLTAYAAPFDVEKRVLYCANCVANSVNGGNMEIFEKSIDMTAGRASIRAAPSTCLPAHNKLENGFAAAAGDGIVGVSSSPSSGDNQVSSATVEKVGPKKPKRQLKRQLTSTEERERLEKHIRENLPETQAFLRDFSKKRSVQDIRIKLECKNDLFCSGSCATQYKMKRSGSKLRSTLFKHEKGVCQSCRVDCDRVFLTLLQLPPETVSAETVVRGNTQTSNGDQNTYSSRLASRDPRPQPSTASRRAFLDASFKKSLRECLEKNTRVDGFLRLLLRTASEELQPGMVWNCDHVVEVRDGGGEASDLSQVQTLCVFCHARKTHSSRGTVS
ncbi:unnamed protein product [Amoebophrya sp. A25]|nr:unnamed protein product [Amoebophrya sp. A25]|eukprot:GSA25T00000793001.1